MLSVSVDIETLLRLEGREKPRNLKALKLLHFKLVIWLTVGEEAEEQLAARKDIKAAPLSSAAHHNTALGVCGKEIYGASSCQETLLKKRNLFQSPKLAS